MLDGIWHLKTACASALANTRLPQRLSMKSSEQAGTRGARALLRSKQKGSGCRTAPGLLTTPSVPLDAVVT